MADDGQPVTYTARGGCEIGSSNGSVSIKSVGSCTITATEAESSPPASDSVTFAIDPARPVIDFGKRSTRFKRDMSYALGATTDPPIDLAYQVVRGANGTANDEMCAVRNGALVWDKKPTAARFPSLDAFCMIRVTAAGQSRNYVTPSPVQALVHIDYPAWNVHASAQTVSYAQGSDPNVTVFEDTGDALGIDIRSDNPDLCGDATTPLSLPLGTTRYRLSVHIEDPALHPDSVDANGAYTCTLTASALPPDYQQGSKGTSRDTFVLTVTP